VQGELELGFSDKSKAQKLKEKILDKAENVFQWAALVVPTVLKPHGNGKSMKDILEKL